MQAPFTRTRKPAQPTAVEIGVSCLTLALAFGSAIAGTEIGSAIGQRIGRCIKGDPQQQQTHKR